MTVVGFDFGTTNSLISAVVGDRAINFVDDEGLPIPSIVCYEGSEVIAGQRAKRRLDSAGLGVHGNIVRSPKVLLGRETVHVGGVNRDPIDIVSDVVKHVKAEALASRVALDLGGVEHAVVTIPVGMNGQERRSLRQAFSRAGITISQFIHEPFAAIYGLFREEGGEELLRRYDRQLLLVVDWGGGTLDLTLCRLDRGELTQLQNGGSNDVGGDEFDIALRNAAIDLFHGGATDDLAELEVNEDARIRLLGQVENAKIALSSREAVQLYVPAFFKGGDGDFVLRMDRGALDRAVEPLIRAGMRQIDELLTRAGIAPAQIGMCIATGGMVNMPTIQARLHERFGPQRVHVSDRSATLVAEGAAWVASDAQPLTLAKRAEVRLARNSFLPVMEAGLQTPRHGQVERRQYHLYCVDPTDGAAKFSFCMPRKAGRNVLQSDVRVPMAEMVVRVDEKAAPFRERLELDLYLDDDLVLTCHGRSLNAKDESKVELYDLEFGIRLPKGTSRAEGAGREESLPDPVAGESVRHEPGDLTLRANIADEQNRALVPGEVLYAHSPGLFDRRFNPPQEQDEERLYYAPCALCGRASNDPACRCGAKMRG